MPVVVAIVLLLLCAIVYLYITTFHDVIFQLIGAWQYTKLYIIFMPIIGIFMVAFPTLWVLNKIIISPKNEEEFIKNIKLICLGFIIIAETIPTRPIIINTKKNIDII